MRRLFSPRPAQLQVQSFPPALFWFWLVIVLILVLVLPTLPVSILVSLCSSLYWSVAFYTEQTRLWRRSGTNHVGGKRGEEWKIGRVERGGKGGRQNKCNAMKIVKNRKTKVFVLFICCCLFGCDVGARL